MAMIKVDGVDLPTPSKFKPPEFDLDSDNSGRNELGYMQRDRIRGDISKTELQWEMLTSAELAIIKTAVRPAKIQVIYPTEIGLVEKSMYTSDRNIEMVTYNEDYTKIVWNISLNLTEY